MGIMDIARTNAYLCRKQLDAELTESRDPHREFIVQLACELILGEWKHAPKLFDPNFEEEASASEASSASHVSVCPSYLQQIISTTGECKTVLSSTYGTQRRKRECVVCRWEEKKTRPFHDTIYCMNHRISLCVKVPEQSEGAPRASVCPEQSEGAPRASVCPDQSMSCWDKYPSFYLPNRLFTGTNAYIRKSSELYRARLEERKTTK